MRRCVEERFKVAEPNVGPGFVISRFDHTLLFTVCPIRRKLDTLLCLDSVCNCQYNRSLRTQSRCILSRYQSQSKQGSHPTRYTWGKRQELLALLLLAGPSRHQARRQRYNPRGARQRIVLRQIARLS